MIAVMEVMNSDANAKRIILHLFAVTVNASTNCSNATALHTVEMEAMN